MSPISIPGKMILSKPTGKMILSRNTVSHMVYDGLVLFFDAANDYSYPDSGTVLTDLSGNDNDGTLVNNVGYSSAYSGALTFDSTVNDNYISVPHDSSLNHSGSLTVSVWFNRGDILTAVPGDQNQLFLKGSSIIGGGGIGDIYLPAISMYDKISYNWLNSGSSQSIITPPSRLALANQWCNITVTHVSGNLPKPYFNGVEKTDWVLSGSSSQPLNTTNYNITIAGDQYRVTGPKALTFNGKISMVHFYNRALTTAEVKQNFDVFRGRYEL